MLRRYILQSPWPSKSCTFSLWKWITGQTNELARSWNTVHCHLPPSTACLIINNPPFNIVICIILSHQVSDRQNSRKKWNRRDILWIPLNTYINTLLTNDLELRYSRKTHTANFNPLAMEKLFFSFQYFHFRKTGGRRTHSVLLQRWALEETWLNKKIKRNGDVNTL